MKKPYHLLPWQRQAIVDAYSAGEKLDALAAEFGINRSYPGLLAARHGIPKRQMGRPRSKSLHDDNRDIDVCNTPSVGVIGRIGAGLPS